MIPEFYVYTSTRNFFIRRASNTFVSFSLAMISFVMFIGTFPNLLKIASMVPKPLFLALSDARLNEALISGGWVSSVKSLDVSPEETLIDHLSLAATQRLSPSRWSQ